MKRARARAERVNQRTFVFIETSPVIEILTALQTGNTTTQGFVTEKSQGFREKVKKIDDADRGTQLNTKSCIPSRVCGVELLTDPNAGL
jgi:hypothetical protein